MAVTATGEATYTVESASGETYTVDLDDSTCTCPDHEIRDERCKHLRRVAIEINQGLVPPPGKVREPCAACGEAAFVDPDADLPLCLDCHLEPGDTVRDRETDDILVVAAVTDRHADAVPIEDGKTVADYATNAAYPDDDLVVEAVYPFSDAPETPFEELPRYAFPISRLERR
jgi:hypothetical protein